MRRRWLIGLSMVLAMLAVSQRGPAASRDPTWKAGTARARITPREPLWMAGYAGRTHAAEGTLHDLWVKVLALEAPDGGRGVLVTSDLLGFPGEMAEEICRRLKAKCGLDRGQIMLTSSHTHTGPVLRDALYDIYPLDEGQRRLIEQYSDVLESRVVETVARAVTELAPAGLWAGEGSTNFAVNRRNNTEKDVAAVLEGGGQWKGPVDHQVPVLAVRAPQAGLGTVVFGYACHCTTLASYQWSGDYAGFAQIALEDGRPGMLAMFHAGCGADQNPLPRRSVERCRRYGGMLAGAVEEVLRGPMRPVAPRLRTGFEVIRLEFQRQPTAEQLEAAAGAGGYRERWAKRLLEESARGKAFPSSYPYPVQVWKLGDELLWISLGGEVVVDYSLRFKRRYGPQTWVTAYANDVMAYIPSRRVWEEGGYEAGAFEVYGLPAERWQPEIEERIAACVDRLVQRVN